MKLQLQKLQTSDKVSAWKTFMRVSYKALKLIYTYSRFNPHKYIYIYVCMYDITNINIPLPSHTIYNKIIYQDFGVHQSKFLASASFPPESPCDHMQFPNDPVSVGTANINQDMLMSCRKYLLSFWHRSPCNNSSIISIIHEEKNTEINIFQRPLTWIFSKKKRS